MQRNWWKARSASSLQLMMKFRRGERGFLASIARNLSMRQNRRRFIPPAAPVARVILGRSETVPMWSWFWRSGNPAGAADHRRGSRRGMMISDGSVLFDGRMVS